MSSALTIRDTQPSALAQAAPKFGLLRPVAPPAEVLSAQEELRSMVAQALTDGRDYGVIPGTNDKKVLLKPGAERLCVAFGLAPSYRIVEQEADHDREVTWVKRKKNWGPKVNGRSTFTWSEDRGVALGLYRYVVECILTHRESGAVIASALGTCSTLESKYADRPRECENTVAKMASKRAFVAVTLNALGLSDQFTQDLEDEPEAPESGKWNAPPPVDPTPAPEPEPLPPLTLKDANDTVMPEQMGGKPMSDTKTGKLAAFVKWAEGKSDLSAHTLRIVDGARLVIAQREVEAKAAQSAFAVGAATAEELAAKLDDAEGADGLPF
jgi:hypothetical protein